MNKILIVNGMSYGRAVDGLGKISTEEDFLENPKQFKLVLFTGGEDVSPSLYNDKSPKSYCGSNIYRDEHEMMIFEIALKNNIPMTGICRGSQFLNVMSGGRMLHHITNHGLMGKHTMSVNTTHKPIEVTSTHHQMSIVGDEGYIIGWSTEKRSVVYIGRMDEEEDYKGKETEAIYYPNTKVFAVQYHPEYMDKESEGYKWFYNGVKDLLELSEEEFKNKYLIKVYNKCKI